jgi:hypothetical protein
MPFIDGQVLTATQLNTLETSIRANVINIAALRLLDSTYISHAMTDGYWASGDNGNGEYWYDSTDTTSLDNGFTVIVANDGGRWKLITDGIYNVKQAGAKGNGDGADEVLAFSIAAKNSQAGNAQELKFTSIDMNDWAVIRVPAGDYTLLSMVDTGNREIIWDVDIAAKITDAKYLNGRLLRSGSKISDLHHGTHDQAVTFSVMANRTVDEVSPISGFYSPSEIAAGNGRDTVGFYAGNRLPPASYSTSSVSSYSATGVVLITPLTTEQQYKMRVGMLVVTKHSTPYGAYVQSWTANSITVQDGWYLIDGVLPGVADTPTGTDGLMINSFRKAWALNANVHIDSTSDGTEVNSAEFGVVNNRSETVLKGGDSKSTGVYSASIGSYYGDSAYLAGGKWDYGFRCTADTGLVSLLYGVNADNRSFYNVKPDGTVEMGERGAASSVSIDFHTGATDCDYDSRIIATGGTGVAGFGDIDIVAGSIGVLVDNEISLTADLLSVSAAQTALTGILLMDSVNASIEIGKQGTSNTPFIDFHSSSSVTDRDARISCSGGTASSGQGTLSIEAKQLVFPALENYVDDAAAATGGIPVNGLYRNGSIIMIRVS